MDTYDIVIVGGGGSGLAAAIEAARRKAEVIVLEREACLGGSTGMSIGAITASQTELQKRKGISDTAEAHFHDMGLFAGPLAPRDNLELRRILVDNVPETMRWLTSLGAVFFGPMPEAPHRQPRMHTVLPNARAYIHLLEKECKRHGVRFAFGARATALVCDGGRVTGLDVSEDGHTRRIAARRAVILASGDYNNGRSMRQRFTSVPLEIPGVNANEGDGQQMGIDVGGEVLNGDIVWGPLLRFIAPRRMHFLTKLPPMKWLARMMRFSLDHLPARLFRPLVLSYITTQIGPEPALFRHGAVLVNKRGQRFTDECDKPAYALATQPDRAGFIVMDRVVMDKFCAFPHFVSTASGTAYAYLQDYKRSRKDLYTEAQTIPSLARKIGVDEKSLCETIAAHNESLEPIHSRKPIATPPFCALGPVGTWMVMTDGGLKISRYHQVLGRQDQPIPGLFAAGSAGQGGLLLQGHGHHLAWAFTSGRRAGQFAVQGVPQDV